MCSLGSLLNTVRRDDCEAWIVLLRERQGSQRTSNPHLNVLQARCQQGVGTEQPFALESESAALRDRIQAICATEFADVFAEPGMPPSRELDHKIILRDPSAPPPKLR